MTLLEFVRLPHRFRWAGPGWRNGYMENDCTTVCASWAEELTGIDPAAGLRRTYHDAEGARAIIDAAGGHVPFMHGKLQPLGFSRVQHPEDGDIGCVIAPTGMNEFSHIGAIRFGPLWAVLAPSGMAGKRLDFVAAWRLS